jgi:hypothetical protein
MISTSKNDKFVDNIDALNYEKSLGTQFKHAWNSIANLWGNDDVSEKSRQMNQAAHNRVKQEKDAAFPIEVFDQLLYAKSKNHGVTIKTMTKVCSNHTDQRAHRK